MPVALITGITGQDGSYLAEHLLEAGYEVAGLCRRLSLDNHARIAHLLPRVRLLRGDLLDLSSLQDAVDRVRPDEVYNLAAQSDVAESWAEPILTAEVTALGAVRVLEAVRRIRPQARVYQASSSEMFGTAPAEPQDESTPFHPRSPYGAAKVHAHHAAINYRESYGMFVACGILFNHESPRRGLDFVTRKISDGVARIRLGHEERLVLGDLSVERDWGFAPDYVRAMHAMLRASEPGEYVVATGVSHSVQAFVERAFRVAGLDWRKHVVSDPALYRPAEIPRLRGDASRARTVLGWRPEVALDDLVRRMVEADLERVDRENRR